MEQLVPQSAPVRCPLVAYHRRRRSMTDLSDLQAASVDTSQPSQEVQKVCEGSPHPAEEADVLPFSPLTCPSPAMFFREDLIRQNVRLVHSEYDFEDCIGEGAFGKVHKATHRRTGVRRAIKAIPKSGTESEEFEWELQALVALDHPHIVKVIEYFVDAEMYYIVMELCTGPDVFSYIIESMEKPGGTGFVSELEASVIARHCLKAMLCCHAHGFVHRDLNAKNFMITGSDQTVKLIDFGLAKRFQSREPKEGYVEIVGTAHYMAPEMMLKGRYSPAADLWSLGVLLYVTLTGVMLLPKDDEKKMACHRKGTYVQRQLQRSERLQKRAVSAQARDMLERLLQHDPAKRLTAPEALSHPFIRQYCHDYLGPPFTIRDEFDGDILGKLRRYGKAPRLQKVAYLMMAHLADHERGLMEAWHTFRTLDTDGDGEISLQDMEEGCKAHKLELPQDLAEVFASCDGDCSGKLSSVEFLACLLPDTLVDERLCHEVFNLLDPESKGRLSASDLQAALPTFDLGMCQKMVESADKTRRGYFDFEDFHIHIRGEDRVAAEPRSLRPRLSTASDG